MAKLSKEVLAIDKYLADSGIPHRTISTFRITKTRHGWVGTSGMGLAVDQAGPAVGWNTKELLAIFNAYYKVAGQLRELFYSGPGVTHNVYRGKLVPLSQIPKSIRDGHHDHVHISVTRGTFIKWTKPVSNNKFPLKPGHYFGVFSADPNCHSGMFSARDRTNFKKWQHRMRWRGWKGMPTKGRYTKEVAKIVAAFQTEKNLPITGKVNERTWNFAYKPRTSKG